MTLSVDGHRQCSFYRRDPSDRSGSCAPAAHMPSKHLVVQLAGNYGEKLPFIMCCLCSCNVLLPPSFYPGRANCDILLRKGARCAGRCAGLVLGTYVSQSASYSGRGPEFVTLLMFLSSSFLPRDASADTPMKRAEMREAAAPACRAFRFWTNCMMIARCARCSR